MVANTNCADSFRAYTPLFLKLIIAAGFRLVYDFFDINFGFAGRDLPFH